MLKLCRYLFQVLAAVVSLLLALGCLRYVNRIKVYEELESRVTQRWYGLKSDDRVRDLLRYLGVSAADASRIARIYAECHQKIGDRCVDPSQASVSAIDDNDDLRSVGSLAQVQQWAFEKPKHVYWGVFALSLLALLCNAVYDRKVSIKSKSLQCSS